MAFVYDPDEEMALRLNGETRDRPGPVQSAHWEAELKAMIERHLAETRSPRAAELLRHWDEALPRFQQVVPKEMIGRLAHPLSDEPAAATA